MSDRITHPLYGRSYDVVVDEQNNRLVIIPSNALDSDPVDRREIIDFDIPPYKPIADYAKEELKKDSNLYSRLPRI